LIFGRSELRGSGYRASATTWSTIYLPAWGVATGSSARLPDPAELAPALSKGFVLVPGKRRRAGARHGHRRSSPPVTAPGKSGSTVPGRPAVPIEGSSPVPRMSSEPLKQKAELPPVPGYRIEGIVGKGATGIVYRARQLSVDRVVALKVLHRELVGATSAAARLQREARATARLAHPNIISAIDMGEVGGMWWYAMELVDGVSLAERLREGPLGEREALRIFIPLCEALEHAFERGVVHRDVKPANILIERGGRALLVDLGLAFADDDPQLTKGGGTLGTPHYISPEQARDPSGADVQSDLWSLGATMYHAVCGRPPFAGESVAEILSSVLYARVPDPAERAPSLSKGFALVLRKCLTRERRHRYQTPAELLADLERIRERRAPRVHRASLEPVAREAPAARCWSLRRPRGSRRAAASRRQAPRSARPRRRTRSHGSRRRPRATRRA